MSRTVIRRGYQPDPPPTLVRAPVPDPEPTLEGGAEEPEPHTEDEEDEPGAA